MTEHMSPIATYREWRYERKCDFELYPDSIRAAGRAAFGHFESTITLSSLDPNFDRLWVPRRLLYSSLFVFLIGLVGLGIVVYGVNHGSFDYLAGFFGLLVLIGFAMALFNRRKVELVRFRSVAGVPMLDVARAGKRSGEFDAFVSALVKQIVSAEAET